MLLLLIYLIKREPRERRIREVKNNYRKEYLVILNRAASDLDNPLTALEKKEILSYPDNILKDWIHIRNNICELKSKYGVVLKEFILSSFDGILLRNTTKEYDIFKPLSIQLDILINSLTYEESILVSQEPMGTWETRLQNKLEADEIRRIYVDGYKRIEKLHKNISDSDVVKLKQKISEYQDIYNHYKAFVDWEDKQNTFSKDVFYSKHKQFCNKDGRCAYQVEYQKPLENGSFEFSNFKICQGFVHSVCPYHLDIQDDSWRQAFCNLSEFQDCSRYFVDDVYYRLYSFISSFSELENVKPIIVLISHSSDIWTKDVYNYHYRKLKSLLINNDYEFYDIEELHKINNLIDSNSIIVVDFYTQNRALIENCRRIIESFDTKIPVIGYLSLIKEYDEREIQKKFKNVSSLQKEFIKQQFERIEKNPYYSYYAITNTLIGEAANSESVKRVWLSDSAKFTLHSLDNSPKGKICCNYSIDGGKTFVYFERDGKYDNLDDVVTFSYDLFIEMGVLDSFMKNGERAISYMNEHHYLKH